MPLFLSPLLPGQCRSCPIAFDLDLSSDGKAKLLLGVRKHTHITSTNRKRPSAKPSGDSETGSPLTLI